MDTAHSTTRCPVYLHPAAASNPATVDRIQQATGQLICIVGVRPQLQPRTARRASDDFGPFGGDAA
jgi:hypothetical protein